MKKIYKYPILSAVQMPKGARILSVQQQHDEIVAWALIDDAWTETVCRKFIVVGTGHALNYHDDSAIGDRWEYLATVQDGRFVWHVFEVIGGAA